jgi:excisionase family DNA binding protein
MMTTREAAGKLDVGRGTIVQMVRRGQLPAQRRGRRLLISAGAVEQLRDRRRSDWRRGQVIAPEEVRLRLAVLRDWSEAKARGVRRYDFARTLLGLAGRRTVHAVIELLRVWNCWATARSRSGLRASEG